MKADAADKLFEDPLLVISQFCTGRLSVKGESSAAASPKVVPCLDVLGLSTLKRFCSSN